MRTGFTDAVGVLLAGTAVLVAGIVRQALVVPATWPEARACLSNLRLLAADAALLGGTAAHATDHDGHSRCPAIPAPSWCRRSWRKSNGWMPTDRRWSPPTV